MTELLSLRDLSIPRPEYRDELEILLAIALTAGVDCVLDGVETIKRAERARARHGVKCYTRPDDIKTRAFVERVFHIAETHAFGLAPFFPNHVKARFNGYYSRNVLESELIGLIFRDLLRAYERAVNPN